MFTLATGETLRGVAGSASAITYTLTGMEKDTSAGTNTYQRLAQGQLAAAAASLGGPVGTHSWLIQTVFLSNTTAGVVTCAFYINGVAGTNLIASFQIEANGFATLTGDGWKTYDSTGKQLFVGSTGAQGIQGEKGWSPILAVVVDGVRRVLQIVDWTGGAGTKPSTTNQFIGPVGIVGTAAAAQDIRGATGAGVPTGGTTGQGLFKNTGTDFDTAFQNTPVDGSTLEITGNNVARIKDGGVTLAKNANAPANTQRANATGSAATPQDVVIGANQFLARNSSGALAVQAVTDAGLAWLALSNVAAETAALNAATVALQGMQSAVDKQKEDNIWLDVTTDFGANNLIKTTGTDQTTKINNILAAAPAGAVLYWPVGTYDTQGNHSWGKLLLMKGQSRSGSVINCTHATNTLFTMTAGADGSGFQTIRLSANTAVLRTAGYAIDFGALPNTYIQQTDILFHWSGVRSAGPLQFMDDANIREMGANAINGNSILIAATGDRYIRRVTMDQAPRTVDFAGVRVNQCSSLVITDSNIIHCGTALHLNANGGAGTAIASVYSANTFYDTSVIGANITCATGTDTVQRATFVRCWFSTMSTAGVQINHANVNSVDFIGCEFYQEQFGIDVTACTEWSVRASRFAGCTTNAIRTAAGATHSFTISDNFIGNGAGFGANAQGINVQAGTYARYQILDNRGLDTNTTPGIIDLGVVPATNQKNVANNMGCVLKGQLQLSTISAGAVTAGRGVATVGTAETYMFGARIPANGVSAGQQFKVTVVAQATAACSVNFATKAGAAATLVDTSIDTHAATAVLINGYVTYECLATVVALGASGNVAGVGQQIHVGSVVGKVAAAEVIATAPTTAAWFLSVSATSTVAAAITVRSVAIEAL